MTLVKYFLFSQKQGKSESLKILKLLFLLEFFKLKSSSIIIITCNYIILKIFLQFNNVNSNNIEWLLYIIYFNGLNATFVERKKNETTCINYVEELIYI